ncbi:S9 family peptidase [Porphyromonas crevioricanis]|nr:S9 family peptidase [Porphyromonas crevioricanis]
MNKSILSAMAAAAIATSSIASAQMPASSVNGGMSAETLLTMARVGGYALSPNGRQVVYTISYPSIEDNCSQSDLFLIGIDGKNKMRLTNTSHSESEPCWIDGGRRIAFLSSSSGSKQLWSMSADGNDLRQLTDVQGGIEGYLFSPDEKEVIYVHSHKSVKTAGDIYPDLPKASGRVVKDLLYKHWDEWVTTTPHPYLAKLADVPISEGKDILQGEPYECPMRPFSGMEDLSWSPDGKQIVYASRKKTGMAYAVSTNSDIYLYDVVSGKTLNLSEGMMGYDTFPKFSPDGKRVAWISMERDGYESDLKRLFVVNLLDGTKEWVNPDFDLNVDHFQWSEDGRMIYFVACKQAETQLWSIRLKDRKICQITDGMWDYTGFDMKNGIMLAARQSFLEPTDLYQVDLRKGNARRVTNENKEIMESLSPVVCQKHWITCTNREKMLVWVLLPPKFDEKKQYPSILYCQGGPQDPISQFWSFRWNLRLMAEQGYVVIAPNRHGVPSFGQKWNEQISGDYGGQNMKDYMTAADELKKEPWIAKDKMGCVGASYGGFSVYWLAGHHEGRFAAFIAHAGIFNIESQYFETEEKWFANWDMGGAPWEKDNGTAQRTFADSPHKFVQNWDTPIMIIHGELDYRILASQGMMAFDAAKMRGVPAEMLIFPDENHWILQPQNAMLWQRSFFGWLDRWLK